MKIGVVCNAPGELWCWARPDIQELCKRGHDVSLWISNCPYASGRERSIALRLGCPVIGPFNPIIAFGKMIKEKVDCVIQLGGDIFWGKLLAKKSPLLCYTYGRKKGLKKCRAVFTAYDEMAREIGNAHVIGDLAKDALSLDLKQETGQEEIGVWNNYNGNRILLLPGSRENIRLKSLDFVKEMVNVLIEEWGDFRPVVLFSPFADDREIALWEENKLNPIRLGAGIVMPKAEYIVTQPGTNNLEILHCGTAGLVIAPLSFLREIPVSVIGGLITRIPFFGMRLKEMVLLRKLNRLNGYVSLTNRIWKRNILDELVGDISPKDVARKIIEVFSDKEKLMLKRDEILKFSALIDNSEHSASEEMCNYIDNL